MFNVLRIVFFVGAAFSFVFFLGMIKRKKWKNAGMAIAACIVLAALGYGSIILNNARINGNQEALKKSRVVMSGIETVESTMNKKYDLMRNPLSIPAKTPWAVVPVEDEEGKLRIANEDSCWSGGGYITTENADQCKTILFYETSEVHEFYTSAKGGSTTGVSKQRTCYLYDVDTDQLIDYELLYKDLPKSAKGTPRVEVSLQEVVNWLKDRIRKN